MLIRFTKIALFSNVKMVALWSRAGGGHFIFVESLFKILFVVSSFVCFKFCLSLVVDLDVLCINSKKKSNQGY